MLIPKLADVCVSFGRSRTVFKDEIVRLEQDDISSFAALQETSCQKTNYANLFLYHMSDSERTGQQP
jgi:hypothetical protein